MRTLDEITRDAYAAPDDYDSLVALLRETQPYQRDVDETVASHAGDVAHMLAQRLDGMEPPDAVDRLRNKL